MKSQIKSWLVGCMLGVLSLCLGITSMSAAVPLVGLSGRAWNSGVFTGSGDAPTYNAFANWRGKPIDSILTFPGRTNWADLMAIHPDVVNFPGIRIIAIPPAPESLGTNGMVQVANGQHNAWWASFGTYLANNGMNTNRTVIRLGWEMNGNWYVWSATTGLETTYINAFRNVVNSIRSTAPNVQINWCVNKGNQSNTNAWAAYPGDAYVDIIGLDFYDFWTANFTDAQWNANAARVPSLNDVSAYCRAHGKQMALDEWGVAHDPQGGDDNPFFIQKVWNWLNANTDIIAYETAYDHIGSPATLQHTLSPPDGTAWNPNAGALYKSLWGSGSSQTAPAAPTNLSAASGNTQVTLSWTASSGATSYNVYRGASAGGESTTPIITGVTTTTYTNTGLTNGTPYYYKVKAVNSAGTSPYSNEATATPAVVSQPLPNGTYTLAPVNAPGLRLNVVNAGTANGTDVNVLTANGATSQQWIFTNLSGSVYRVSPAHASAQSLDVNGQSTASGANVQTWQYLGQQNQKWALSAVSGGYEVTPQHATGMRLNATGTSSGSNVNQATANASTAQRWSISPVGAPAAPTGLSATAGNAHVQLSWTASSGANSYNVYRGTSPGGEGASPLVSGIATTSYTNTGLTNGTTYYYKVAAVNGSGTSGLSNEASATPSSGGSGNTHGGTWAARGVIPSSATYVSLYRQATCAQNTTYVAKIWVKGSGNFIIKTLNSSWVQIAQSTFSASSTWTEKSLTFTTPNTASPTVIFYLADAGGGGTLYVDDAFMGVSGGTNVLSNAGFESGTSGWTAGSPVWSILQNP